MRMSDLKKKDGKPGEDAQVEPDLSQIEPLSDEFYALLVFAKDRETNDLLFKVGLRIRDDGQWKYMRPMFREEIEETLKAWCEGLIEKSEMQEYIRGLGSGKITRYKLASELKARRRDAVKIKENPESNNP